MGATFVTNGRTAITPSDGNGAGNGRARATAAMRLITLSEERLAGQALCALLARSKLVEEIHYAGPLADWADAVEAYEPNTLVWLGPYADRSKLDTVATIRERCPDLAVCIVTERVETIALREVIRHGAERLGVVLRNPELDGADVLKSLVQLTAGRATLSPEVLEQLVVDTDTDDGGIGTLSHSEHSVLRLLAAGLRNREIARRLKMREKLVERHITRIFSKLGLRRSGSEDLDRRVMAARMYFLRDGSAED